MGKMLLTSLLATCIFITAFSLIVLVPINIPHKYTAQLVIRKRRAKSYLAKVMRILTYLFVADAVLVLACLLYFMKLLDQSMILGLAFIAILFSICLFLRVFVQLWGLASLEREHADDYKTEITKIQQEQVQKSLKAKRPKKTKPAESVKSATIADFDLNHAGSDAKTSNFNKVWSPISH